MVDTLSQYYCLPKADSVVWGRVATSPADLYGASSLYSGEVITDVVAINDGLGAVISWQNGVGMLVLLLLFCFAMYRFSIVARISFKAIFSTSETALLFESSTSEFKHYIKYGCVMFLLAAAIMLDGLAVGDVSRSFVNIVAGVVALFAVSMISGGVLRLVSNFDYNASRWDDLRAIRKMDRTIAAYFFAVPVIIFSYWPSMHIVLWVMVCVAVGIHFFRLLLFFIRRGFSFLQWILYLCAVEIAPFALLWGILARLNGIHF